MVQDLRQFTEEFTVVLNDLNGLTERIRLLQEEIAANLKLPLGTVKTQIHRAREQMCRLITEGEKN